VLGKNNYVYAGHIYNISSFACPFVYTKEFGDLLWTPDIPRKAV